MVDCGDGGGSTTNHKDGERVEVRMTWTNHKDGARFEDQSNGRLRGRRGIEDQSVRMTWTNQNHERWDGRRISRTVDQSGEYPFDVA